MKQQTSKNIIDDKELEKGYCLCIANAKSLIDEAEILKDKGFISRSYTLFQFAIEECGKSHIIFKAIIDYYNGTKIDDKYLYDNGFVDHLSKIKKSISSEFAAIMLFTENSSVQSEIFNRLINNLENVNQLNDFKNESLYTCFKNNKFINPNNLITIKMLLENENKAKFQLSVSKQIFYSLDTLKNAAAIFKEEMNDPIKLKKWQKKYDLLVDKTNK